MNKGTNKPKTDAPYNAFNFTLAALVGQVGCLTVIIIALALFTGITLDNVFNSKPWFTIFSILASMPVTLVVMFWVTRWTTSKLKFPEPEEEVSPQEEAEVGRDT